MLRCFSGADPTTYCHDAFDDEYSRHEVRRRYLDTLDHPAIATRFFASTPSLSFLGLSLHSDNSMDFWVPSSTGTAQKHDASTIPPS